MSMTHICSVEHENSRTYLPYSADSRKPFHRLCRCLKDWCMIWKNHPLFMHYYRSKTAYLEERRLQASNRHKYLIHPLSKTCFGFDSILLVAYLMAFGYYPLAASFLQLRYEDNYKRYIKEQILWLVFTIEIMVRFVIGHRNYRKKKITMNQTDIIRSYIRSIYFIADISAALPVLYLSTLTDNVIILMVMQTIRLLKLIRLMTLMEYFRNILTKICLVTYKGWFSSVAVMIICFHWGFCAYYGVQRVRAILGGETPEIYEKIFRFVVRDITGAYYIESAFRTMGVLISARRDTAAWRPLEQKIMCLVYMVFGRIMMLVLGVLFINLLLRSSKLDTEYREVIVQLEEYMNRKKLPLATRNRLISFYEYRFQGKFIKVKKIENILSDRLKKEISYHASTKLISQVKIFEDIPTKILQDVIGHLKAEVFLPNDLIISAGAPSSSMYFICSGTVCVTTASGREVCHLHDGGYFGEAALVLNHKKSISSVTALETCETFRLDAKSFRHCFSSCPEVFHRLKVEAEKREQETIHLENEFQEKLFFMTYTGERKFSFDSHTSETKLNTISTVRF